MSDNQLKLFTARFEAIEIFKILRNATPEAGQLWPLLPVLCYIAPVGSGKSILIEHLRDLYCKDTERPLPYVRVDFAESTTPKNDLLLILVEIRNNLQKRKDAYDQHFTFPRFDFAAAIALAALEESHTHLLSAGDIKTRLTSESSLLDAWSESASALGNIVPQVPLILAAVRATLQIEPLQKFLGWLENGPVWEWYKAHADVLKLPADVKIERVIRRLDEMSAPGESDRITLVEQVLPEALLADLRDALNPYKEQQAWLGADRVVIFLNHFELLLNDPGRMGKRLLEILSLTEHRKHGGTDPLLLVVGSQQSIMVNNEQDAPFTIEPTQSVDQQTAHMQADTLYKRWQAQLPLAGAREDLRFKNLYLPLVLRDFGFEETRQYLHQFGRLHHTKVFDDNALVDAIYNATKGHPFFLSLVAAAIDEAGSSYEEIDLKNLALEDGEKIADYLLNIFLEQLGKSERTELIWSAAPLNIDEGILQAILQQENDTKVEAQLATYARLPFVRSIKDRLVLHPVVRSLLLQKMPPTRNPQKDYYRIHKRLWTYFHDLNQRVDDEQSRLGEVYHALALGDPQPAINLAYLAQEQNLTLWDPLLNVIAQAPSGPLPLESSRPTSAGSLAPNPEQITQQAAEALQRAIQNPSLRDSVTAIVLYRWLLTASHHDLQRADLLQKLGNAYSSLRSGDRIHNLEIATAYLDQSLAIKDLLVETHQQAKLMATPSQTLVKPEQESLIPEDQTTSMATRNTLTPTTANTEILPPVDPQKNNRTPITANTQHGNSGGGISRVRSILSLHNLRTAFTRQARRRRIATWTTVIAPLIALLVVSVIFVTAKIPVLSVVPPVQQITPSLPAPDARGIGVVAEANGSEYVGLSDGTVPFDIARPDHDTKIQAATAFKAGHLAAALALWQQAHKADPNDAEVLIYQENQRILSTGNHCIYTVVATNLSGDSGDSVTIGRDDLQGAYVVQKEQNDSPSPTKLCLLIANVGSNPTYADNVVIPQIVRAAAKLGVKAVTGWPTITESPNAVSQLNNMGIPIISAANYNSLESASNLFHIVPSNQTEGMKSAQYAEKAFPSARIVIFADLSDPYSRGLREGFETQLMQDGLTNNVVAHETYAANCTGIQNVHCQQTPSIATLLTDAARYTPDLIYFAGNANDGEQILANLAGSGLPRSIHILGGDELYQLVGYPNYDRPNFQDLTFTAFAYYAEPSVAAMQQRYAQYFDPGDNLVMPLRSYGYSRPDSNAILAFDATSVLVSALNSIATQAQFTPVDLQKALLHNVQGLQGASRTITFNENLEPEDNTLVVLRVNADGSITDVGTF